MTGNIRNPFAVTFVNPYEVGDQVKIGGKVWTVASDMKGWYITSDGSWRGAHPTIKGIDSMSGLIRAIEQAATTAPGFAI